MPTYTREDGKPIVQFDPDLEISPFALYRRLTSERPPLLLDARKAGGNRTLAKALPYPDDEWTPTPSEAEVVVFDENGGREAHELVTDLRARGCVRARLLFGGLDLYEFSLDPEVVGGDTFLVRVRT